METRLKNLLFRIKGFMLRMYLILHGCKIGKGLKCKQFPVFRTVPKGNIEIKNNVNIGYRISFDISKAGKVEIGNNVNLTQDIMISSMKKVKFGDDVLIAENVSIRDGDHLFSKNKKINRQGLSAEEISIGEDVWIGAGVRILKGCVLAKGCIIASNAVMTQKISTDEYGIYGGIPAKKIGSRT